MIALVAGVVLVGVAAGCFAALLRPRGAIAFALASGVLAFAEVVAVSHALSFADAYARHWFLAALAIVALVAAAATAAIRPPRPTLLRPSVIREVLDDRLLLVLAGVVVVELVYLLGIAVLTPPNDLDALMYHLTRAVLWIQQRSVSPVRDVADTRIDEFPPDAEILQGATMLLSGSVRWVGLVQLGALLATMAAICGIAGRIGLDRRSAAFGALVFATLPVVALQAPTAMNDLVVAALVASAAFFALGRSPGELALACVTVALLIGTKVTGLLAVPVLLALVLMTHRGRRLWMLLLGGVVGALLGAVWYTVNVSAGTGPLGTTGERSVGAGDGALAVAARFTRYAVETVELPGAVGRDRFLYLVAAVGVAIAGVLVGRASLSVVGAALTALPLVVLPLERALHSVYWHGWELAGYPAATTLGAGRDSTLASQGQSWYGPVGLALAVIALLLALRRARQGDLPWTAVALALAPVALVAGSAVAVGYHPLSGRYVMGGVALSAATWGLLRRFRAGSAAVVAVAATTLFLSLVNSAEKPVGIDVLEQTDRRSVWTLPRAWVQNVQPELARVTDYIDSHAEVGDTMGLTRDPWIRPFVYVGYPGLDHRIVYADTLGEATRRAADWAVLPMTAGCEPGWEVGLRSPPWAVYRHVPGATCR